jgi:transcriptional regulator with XRE-family HTH domain
MWDYAVLFISVQDPSDQLRAFMATERISQETIAKRAGVSQSTVSRALSRTPERHSEACKKLFRYAQIKEGPRSAARQEGRRRVLKAFDQVWDGSEEYAEGVARIIEALQNLPQRARKKKGARR